MRFFTPLAFVLVLAACGQTSAPETAPAAEAEVATAATLPPWAICDGIDQPTILEFGGSPELAHGRVLQIDKTTGQTVFDADVAYGPGDGAAGSVYHPLLIDGADAGHVRNINPGMLEAPGVAYTLPVTSVRFRGADVSCRWLPRTRLAGFSNARSLVIHEDQDGDLIYTTFDFSAAANAAPIELSQNGRSTPFSVEVRGGEEQVRPGGAEFQFAGRDGYSYRVITENGVGRIEVWRSGDKVLTEPLTAYLVGDAAAQ